MRMMRKMRNASVAEHLPTVEHSEQVMHLLHQPVQDPPLLYLRLLLVGYLECEWEEEQQERVLRLEPVYVAVMPPTVEPMMAEMPPLVQGLVIAGQDKECIEEWEVVVGSVWPVLCAYHECRCSRLLSVIASVSVSV